MTEKVAAITRDSIFPSKCNQFVCRVSQKSLYDFQIKLTDKQSRLYKSQ